ncbi:MAG: PorP/SprF family type IX secretion system membrane protein [Saprospiraceae bacterium]|nr:PorP/SprF family type IX secretion system membrane protein [Saprospiraceae bacterium]
MKVTRFIVIGLLLAIPFTCLQAQQLPQYSLFTMNQLNRNPAYAGMEGSLSITGAFRKQWTGLEGSPTTQNLTAHLPFALIGGGFGISVENDELGAERTTSAELAYSYQLPLADGLISVGLSAGFLQRSLDGQALRTPEGEYADNVVNHNDLVLPIQEVSANTPVFGAGLYFQNEWLELGLAAENLLESSVSFSAFELLQKRTFFANAGARLELLRALVLHPAMLVQSDLAETQLVFSATLEYNGNIFGGAALRGYNESSLDGVAIIAGFNLSENLKLAYAYDITISELNSVSNGSHEVMINFNLNKDIGAGIPPPIIYNPRSL